MQVICNDLNTPLQWWACFNLCVYWVCFSPYPIKYTQNTWNIWHVLHGTMWYFCTFFKSLMLVTIYCQDSMTSVCGTFLYFSFCGPKKERRAYCIRTTPVWVNDDLNGSVCILKKLSENDYVVYTHIQGVRKMLKLLIFLYTHNRSVRPEIRVWQHAHTELSSLSHLVLEQTISHKIRPMSKCPSWRVS